MGVSVIDKLSFRDSRLGYVGVSNGSAVILHVVIDVRS